MANNDRKQIPIFVAPRCGAICYVSFFLSLLTFYEGTPQKSTKSHIYQYLTPKVYLRFNKNKSFFHIGIYFERNKIFL